MSNYLPASILSTDSLPNEGGYLIVSKIAENDGSNITNIVSLDRVQRELLQNEMHDLMLRVKQDYGQAILNLAEK
jgi:hypothetical protein